jgi:hypothetical protein
MYTRAFSPVTGKSHGRAVMHSSDDRAKIGFSEFEKLNETAHPSATVKNLSKSFV